MNIQLGDILNVAYKQLQEKHWWVVRSGELIVLWGVTFPE